jgi:hypothetical protein
MTAQFTPAPDEHETGGTSPHDQDRQQPATATNALTSARTPADQDVAGGPSRTRSQPAQELNAGEPMTDGRPLPGDGPDHEIRPVTRIGTGS